MLPSELASRLHGVHVFERGWLSSNNILFVDGERSLLVDSGYCTHSAQTLLLVDSVLGDRPLDSLVNTHLHSDHCGGNAALQSRFPKLETFIPPGQACSVDTWDSEALTYLPTGQLCPRFTFSATLRPGAEMRFGSRVWQVHAAAGHDPHSLVFFDPAEKILISADALWENGFGVVFPELEGSDAFAEVAATLDMIAALKPDMIIPGHGAVFTYSAEVLARARGRLDYFVRSPIKHARHAAKVLIKFKLLEKKHLSIEELFRWATATPYVMQIHRTFFKTSPSSVWLNELLIELTASGAVKKVGNRVFSD